MLRLIAYYASSLFLSLYFHADMPLFYAAADAFADADALLLFAITPLR